MTSCNKLKEYLVDWVGANTKGHTKDIKEKRALSKPFFLPQSNFQSVIFLRPQWSFSPENAGEVVVIENDVAKK